MRYALLALVLVLLPADGQAQDEPPPVVTPLPPEEPSSGFAGWSGGAVMGFWNNLTGGDLIRSEADVSVDELGVIHVERVANVGYGMAFELHHTFQLTRVLALGPAVFVVPGEDELLRGAGVGGVAEMRAAPNQPASFTVFAGVLVLVDQLRLAPGFVDGQRAPTLPVRFQRREEAALFVGAGGAW